MKLFYKLLLIIYGFVFAYPLSSQKSDWVFRKETEGIKAYTQKHDWSKFDEYRIETTIDGNLSAILAVFKDFDIYPVLFDGFDEIINHVNEPDRYVNYITINTPFPARNRDGVYVNELKYNQDQKLLHIDITCSDEYYNNDSGYVQIKNCNGFWDIKDIGGNKLKIVHQFVMDPGGNVPAFIINMQTVKNPLKTMKTLKKLILEPKYQNREFEILNP